MCDQLEQVNEEPDASHAAIRDGASEPTIRSIPEQVSEEPDASRDDASDATIRSITHVEGGDDPYTSKSSADSDSKPTKERESKCIQALTSYVPDHESLNAQKRQHFVLIDAACAIKEEPQASQYIDITKFFAHNSGGNKSPHSSSQDLRDKLDSHPFFLGETALWLVPRPTRLHFAVVQAHKIATGFVREKLHFCLVYTEI